jgi:hypothetical protein
MTKTYRDWSSDQAYLFPPSPHDWLPEGDLVYFLLDTVATLDPALCRWLNLLISCPLAWS